MKTLNILAFFLFVSFVFSCNGQTQNKTSNSKTKSANKIEILDFHSTHRCKSCLSIEAFTKETLQKYFAKELKSGKITFKLINADDKANEKIVEKFDAYGTTLCINVIKNGKEKNYNITDFAFMNCENKEKFMAEFKLKVAEQLSKI